jgi:hypothetical protein
MSGDVEQTDRQEIAATESEFFAKLAKWKAAQAGPRLTKSKAGGLYGRKPKVPREKFEAQVEATRATLKARQKRELSFPAPKCTK